MAGFFALLGTLLTSLVVALLAALQLADFFGIGDEFVWVPVVLTVFGLATIVIFAMAFNAAERPRTINQAAMVLALQALLLAFLPGLSEWAADRSAKPLVIARANMPVVLELVIPALLIVLVQWGLVRRRWLRTAGEDGLTLWPWFTTALAGLVILNPLGLAIVSSALEHSVTDWLWRFWATITATGTGILVVMAAIECYIRGRVLRRWERALSNS